MAVDDTLDFTPNYTMSTLQTPIEEVNIIINAILIFFILMYIKICVSKLVYFTRSDTFSYSAWIRAYVFVNSDDLLRIFSWCFGRYTLKESHWKTQPNKLQWRRLLWPMSARFFIFIASMISIAITIEDDRVLNGCQNGDYALIFNEKDANLNYARRTRPVCLTIPVTSNVGKPNATAAYCSCVTPSNFGRDMEPSQGSVQVVIGVLPPSETIHISIFKDQTHLVETSYIEWKTGNIPDKTFRSRLSNTVQVQKLTDSVQTWFETDYSNCQNPQLDELNTDDVEARALIYACTPSGTPQEMMDRLQSRIITSLTWARTYAVQERLTVDTFLGNSDPYSANYVECIVPIIVSRQLVNMAPLALFLAALMVVYFIIRSLPEKSIV